MNHNEVTALIRRMTQDLRALQNAMREAKNEPLPNGSHEGLLNEIIDTELVAEFKGAIDEVRYFLWCYVDIFAAQYQSNSSHYRAENSHLRLVSEMLQILSQAPAAPAPPGVVSFFERIDSVVSDRLLVEEQRRKAMTDAA